MSPIDKPKPYVFQPHGMQDKEHWATGRCYAVRCESDLTVIDGLTKAEAESICEALLKLKAGPVMTVVVDHPTVDSKFWDSAFGKPGGLDEF